MTSLRNIVNNLVPDKIHHHQSVAQREINHAASVVELQRRETDLLAAEVWRSMGGHP